MPVSVLSLCEAHRVHKALIRYDALDRAAGILRVRGGVQRDTVGDRLGDIRHRHALAAGRLQAAAISAAVIDEIDPGLLCSTCLRVVERARDEMREIRFVAHLVRFAHLDLRDVAAGDRVLLGVKRARGDRIAVGPEFCRILDGELDSRVPSACLQRLGKGRFLDRIQIIVAVAVDAELERSARRREADVLQHEASSSR